MLDAKDSSAARQLFKKYYEGYQPEFQDLSRREFGFGDFDKKIAFRHYAFSDAASFKRYILDHVPAFISFSSSIYKNPAARPMEKKVWIGSDLIFDLDASDLHLDCQAVHGRAWVCENCLSMVKEETVKLVEDFLIPDFGFSSSEIKINFSGNRGYHVRVSNNTVFSLGPAERRSITEYISGMNMDIASFFPTMGQRAKRLIGPKPSDYGWGGKLAKGIIHALNSGEAELVKLGIDKKTAKKLSDSRADVIFGITTGNWDKVNIPKKAEFWSNALRSMAIAQGDSIDRNVTNDIHHLIRMPNTIHGDTGLIGKTIGSMNELSRFDPMKDSVVFNDGHIVVLTSRVPKFNMCGQEYGPFNGEKAELPTCAAIYLILKRVATIEHAADRARGGGN